MVKDIKIDGKVYRISHDSFETREFGAPDNLELQRIAFKLETPSEIQDEWNTNSVQVSFSNAEKSFSGEMQLFETQNDKLVWKIVS